MKLKYLLTPLIIVLLLVPTVQAQDPLADACGWFGGYAGFEWICSIKALSNEVTGIVESISTDFEAMSNAQFDYFLTDAMSYVSDSLGLAEIDIFVAELTGAIRGGKADASTIINDQLNSFRTALFNRSPANYAPYTPDWFYEMARNINPNIRAADAADANRVTQYLGRTIETERNAQQTQDIATAVAELSGAKETTDKVLGNPLIGALGFDGGDANNLRDAARTAISTRAGIQTLTEGLAVYMEQNAAYSYDIAEKMTAQTQIQALTNYQMRTLVDTLSAEAMIKVEERQAKMQTQINEVYEQGQQAATNLKRVSNMINTTMGEDATQIQKMR